MKNPQPIFSIESLPNGDTSPVSLPRLSLPQVTPAQVIAKRQRSQGVNSPQFRTAWHMTPFPQTPTTPPLVEPLPTQSLGLRTQQDTSSVSFLPVPQVPFPTPHFDFSRSLRAGVTYIPRSMTRHKEPNIADALIACGTLIVIGLFVLILLYYFSL